MAFMTTSSVKVLQSMLGVLPVCLTVAYLITETSSRSLFRRATDSNRTDFCATDQPSATYDVDQLQNLIIQSDSTLCLQPEALCSLKCTREPGCISFNWNAESRSCELYLFAPTQCGYVPNCVNFESTSCGQSSCGSTAFKITADNVVQHLYIDGCEITNLPGRNDWQQTDTVPLPLTANVIAVKLFNLPDGNVGGILASTDTGIRTDSTWKATTNYTDGWMNVTFDDSTWKSATMYGENGIGPWKTRPGISIDAQWISCEFQKAETVFFRYQMKRRNL